MSNGAIRFDPKALGFARAEDMPAQREIRESCVGGRVIGIGLRVIHSDGRVSYVLAAS